MSKTEGERVRRLATATADFPILDMRQRLLDWYEVNRRDLPWRGKTDPYAILVSEVMLQQTGVNRVVQAYERFLTQFPTFQRLAGAPRLEVLRAWAGLGYNRRAVHLHQCAQIVVREHDGRLPDDPVALRRIPGIGPYTVAAILSFAFHRDVPTIDTNVRRVIGRIAFGRPVADRDLRDAAGLLFPPGRSSDWNQALMDFGSSLCTASNPRCRSCPMLDLCAAALHGAQVEARPAKKVAERPEPYLGSRRFYRGKIVAQLRNLAPGVALSAEELLCELKANWTAEDIHWVEQLAEALADEGLARVLRSDGQFRVAAPG